MKPHLFAADPDVPPDPFDRQQRRACTTCHRMGAPDDANHTLPEPAGLDVQQLRAGETGDEA